MSVVKTRTWELGIFAAAILLDQWSKWVVSRTMALGTSIEVLGRFFRLTYIHNPNAAFGIALFGGGFHLIFSIVALGLLLFVRYRTPLSQRGVRIALTLILGGAIGNFIDRIRMGEVVDFFDFAIGRHHWPVFNVADIAVTVGVFLLIFFNIRDSAGSGQQSADKGQDKR